MSTHDDSQRPSWKIVIDGNETDADDIILFHTEFLKKHVRRRRQALSGRWDLRDETPSDVVQRVWFRFFSKGYHARSWDTVRHLRQFLLGMTNNVLRELLRNHRAQKRGGGREMSLEQLIAETSGGRMLASLVDGCNESLMLELWEEILNRIPRAKRDIVALLAEGRTCSEVADLTGLSESSIRRLHEQVCFQ